ncbi:pentapeptide repeat-containing protein [Rhizobium sp. 2MFCol3.1]|uniref:pentapeptide repeat-containing protein n=1 Tax=Rhizobium sp. 2MFCol3.1 TaxID=1246459 RepID=UPI001FD914E7|nr:pentapeptide repeat-containing protein [Rhizobium sp. 2MFCol3.1]
MALAASVAAAVFTSSISAADCGSTATAGIDWGGCSKKNLMLQGGDFQKGNLADADFTLTNLSHTNLASANLEKATLVRTWFTGSDLSKANFSKVEAYRSGFEGVNAEGANFTGAELQRANFNGATLKSVNFEKAELGRVTFKGADVTGANFSLTNLSRADLSGATFTGPISFDRAFLFLTRISGLDLSQATGLDEAQVALACGDSKTKLPQGMATPTSWPCDAD